MRRKLITIMMTGAMIMGLMGQSLLAAAGDGKPEQGGSVTEANKKLAAAQKKTKEQAEKKALKANIEKVKKQKRAR